MYISIFFLKYMFVCKGGLPPNGTAHSSDSLGQGNSKVRKLLSFWGMIVTLYFLQVDANTKALQCLATICSCLRYFGHVIVGVSRTSDRLLLVDKVLSVTIILDNIQCKRTTYMYACTTYMYMNAHVFANTYLYTCMHACIIRILVSIFAF